MDDFEKYLSSQLENAEFKAEWDRLESERNSKRILQKKFPSVRLCKAHLLKVTDSGKKSIVAK